MSFSRLRLTFIGLFLWLGLGALAVPPPGAARLELTFVLPACSLDELRPAGAAPFDLPAAKLNGLTVADAPSLGSGLDLSPAGLWFGLTDRGPNSQLPGPDGLPRRVLPLPTFAPGIVEFRTNGCALEVVRFIALRGSAGHPLTGLGNTTMDEPGFLSATAPCPLASDPGGVDPEGLRCLPDGGFLVAEEYGPSLLRVDSEGVVLWRLIPAGHALPGAPYPVQALLPAAFRHRRANRGFENLALSADARTAYLALQSPALPELHPQAAISRIIRLVELDLSNPAQPRVTGHFLAHSPQYHDARFLGPTGGSFKWNDLVWLAPRRLLVLEQGPDTARLLELDLTPASNLLGRPEENDPALDADGPGVPAHLQVAQAFPVADLSKLSRLGGHKLEGLVRLAPDRFAVTNDNDFGMGENAAGLPSKLWLFRCPLEE